ncbi:MAG: hypothetical protein IKB96_07725, partial [Prevotella sp.]|nr:hypothetical protein [Prevotella sp.]
MDGLKIYYQFRNGDYLVVPADGYKVNGKCVDICRKDEIKVDFNPYHDPKTGKFASKGVEIDSLGNKLTTNQLEFFKDSKVRDSDGKLQV